MSKRYNVISKREERPSLMNKTALQFRTSMSIRRDHDSDKEKSDKGDQSNAWYKQQDVVVFTSGILFICALIGAMFGLGEWKQWNAPSGNSHNSSITSQHRFLPEPPDRLLQASWYYWKNKPEDTNAWTRLFVWICYLSHQFAIWILIYLAQVDSLNVKDKYKTCMNRYGVASFGVTIFFHLLHLLQTHTTYDGLAKDVTITSSQCSVITLIVIIHILEYSERGYMLGWPTLKHTGKLSSKLRLNMKPVYLLRRYHGYGIAWGTIYDFWYHPMENTYGHTLGFFYTFMFMLQGSLLYTQMHVNRWWRLAQEFWLVLHGTAVALESGTNMWSMFLFGFLFMFVLTWIFILPFWERNPAWMRAIPGVVYVIAVLLVYGLVPGQSLSKLYEILFIPFALYFAFFLPWLVIYITQQIQMAVAKPSTRDMQYPGSFARLGCLLGFLLVYILNVAIAIILEVTDIMTNFYISMVAFMVIYLITVPLSLCFVKSSMPKTAGIAKLLSEKKGKTFITAKR